MQTNKKEKKGWIYIQLFILGLISMSKICSIIFLNILHFPFIVPEVIWILFLLLNYKKSGIIFKIAQNKYFIFILLYCVMISLISIISGQGITDAFSMLRAIILFVFAIVAAVSYIDVDVECIWWMSFGAVVGDVLAIFMSGSDELVIINHVAWLSCAVLCFLVKHKWKILATYFIAAIGAVMSAYRINIILILTAFLGCLIWFIFRKQKQNVKTIIFKVALVVILFLVLNFIKNNLIDIVTKIADRFNMGQYEKYRTITRLQMLIDGTSTAGTDAERINCIKRIFSDFYVNLLPGGVLNKIKYVSGTYMDSPMLILYNYVGSMLAMVLVAIWFVFAVRTSIATFANSNLKVEYKYAGLMFPGLVLLLILNGSFLMFNYVAGISGIIVGLMIKFNKERLE